MTQTGFSPWQKKKAGLDRIWQVLKPHPGQSGNDCEKALLADIDGDQQPEIVVIARSAGTGGYLSAYAFGFTKNTLAFRTEVEGLAPDKNPVNALRNCTTKPN